jgi:hypothetical protein
MAFDLFGICGADMDREVLKGYCRDRTLTMTLIDWNVLCLRREKYRAVPKRR